MQNNPELDEWLKQLNEGIKELESALDINKDHLESIINTDFNRLNEMLKILNKINENIK